MVDTTTVREIMQQCHKDCVQDCQANLLLGVTLLEPDMTVNEAGLEDGEEISLVWSEPFFKWPAACHAFTNCCSLAEVEIPSSVNSIEPFAFDACSSMTCNHSKPCGCHWIYGSFSTAPP